MHHLECVGQGPLLATAKPLCCRAAGVGHGDAAGGSPSAAADRGRAATTPVGGGRQGHPLDLASRRRAPHPPGSMQSLTLLRNRAGARGRRRGGEHPLRRAGGWSPPPPPAKEVVHTAPAPLGTLASAADMQRSAPPRSRRHRSPPRSAARLPPHAAPSGASTWTWPAVDGRRAPLAAVAHRGRRALPRHSAPRRSVGSAAPTARRGRHRACDAARQAPIGHRVGVHVGSVWGALVGWDRGGGSHNRPVPAVAPAVIGRRSSRRDVRECLSRRPPRPWDDPLERARVRSSTTVAADVSCTRDTRPKVR